MSGRPAFDDVYRCCAGRVYRYCLSQVSNRADAEDIAADVFAAAFRAYPAAELAAASVSAWLLRIAHNAVIDHRRRHTRRSALLNRLGRNLNRANEADPLRAARDEPVRNAPLARSCP